MKNEITIQVHASFTTAVDPSPRVCQVASMFGLGVDQSKTLTLIPPTTLKLAPHQILFITGASGGGKTTLLRQIAAALHAHASPSVCHAVGSASACFPSSSPSTDMPTPSRGHGTPDDHTPNTPAIHVIDFASLREMPDRPIVESLPGQLEDAIRYLALAGLNDAFVMLRKISQLSDGQRYRFQLARAIALAEQKECNVSLTVILADEFGATLDRLTAQVIARNIRKWTRKAPVCFIAATTHDDLLEPLDPDTLILQHPGAAMEVLTRGKE